MSDDSVDSSVGVLERPRQHRENRKKNIGRKVADNQAQAVAKFIRVPPRKARLVINEVRGKYAGDALAFLRFVPNRAAQYISKVLTSAVANAANNHGLNPANLKLVECRVDEGPRMKRVQPRAQGRAYRILKRMSHITVIVEEVEPKPRKPRKASTRRDQNARRSQSAPVIETTPAATTAEDVTTPGVTGTEDTAAVATQNTAPAENVTSSADTPQGPQTANPATTDEIGAPTTPPAQEPTTPSTNGEANADAAPETADTQDKTDEIGAPIE